MINPVRKLSFKASDGGYRMSLDMDVDRDKAIDISGILEDEDNVSVKMSKVQKDVIFVKAKGVISAKSMRLIVVVLAR